MADFDDAFVSARSRPSSTGGLSAVDEDGGGDTIAIGAVGAAGAGAAASAARVAQLEDMLAASEARTQEREEQLRWGRVVCNAFKHAFKHAFKQ
jgi:hypothetical protein